MSLAAVPMIGPPSLTAPVWLQWFLIATFFAIGVSLITDWWRDRR